MPGIVGQLLREGFSVYLLPDEATIWVKPSSALTAALRTRIRESKPDIVPYLRSPKWQRPTETWGRAEWEEEEPWRRFVLKTVNEDGSRRDSRTPDSYDLGERAAIQEEPVRLLYTDGTLPGGAA